MRTWDLGSRADAGRLPCRPSPPRIRRLVLIELVKVDLEQRATRNRRKPLESYTARFFLNCSRNGEPPCDLIYEEYHIRRTAGDSVTPARLLHALFPPAPPDALRRVDGNRGLFGKRRSSGARRGPSKASRAGQKIDDFGPAGRAGKKGAFGSVFLARQTFDAAAGCPQGSSADKGNEPQNAGPARPPPTSSACSISGD